MTYLQKSVDTAFKSVTDAREERITKVNEANKYKNEKINEVIGKESAILSNANAQKTVLIEKAKGEVAKFNSLMQNIKKPTSYKKRLDYKYSKMCTQMPK